MTTYAVTGANRGIGLEICRHLSQRGDQVIALCRESSPELLALNLEVVAAVDVAAPGLVAQMAKQLQGRTIDVLAAYRPTGKGRVERQVLIVRDHVITGRAFDSIAELDRAFAAVVRRCAGPSGPNVEYVLRLVSVDRPARYAWSFFGVVDLLAVPHGTRAKRVALVHGLVNAGVIILFAGAWVVRTGADSRAAGGAMGEGARGCIPTRPGVRWRPARHPHRPGPPRPQRAPPRPPSYRRPPPPIASTSPPASSSTAAAWSAVSRPTFVLDQLASSDALLAHSKSSWGACPKNRRRDFAVEGRAQRGD